MLYPSLFDSFFAPTRVIVVSEERLREAENQARQEQLEALDNRIDQLTQYRTALSNQLKATTKSVSDLDALDGGTHDG